YSQSSRHRTPQVRQRSSARGNSTRSSSTSINRGVCSRVKRGGVCVRLESSTCWADRSTRQVAMMTGARDGEELAVRSNGGDWLIAWHSPTAAPEGLRHGANAFCVTADNHVVLISGDGVRWGWPGGRPEGDESWEQTLRREILEEACAVVVDARLLGFCRGVCLTGPEEHRVLVRAVLRREG